MGLRGEGNNGPLRKGAAGLSGRVADSAGATIGPVVGPPTSAVLLTGAAAGTTTAAAPPEPRTPGRRKQRVQNKPTKRLLAGEEGALTALGLVEEKSRRAAAAGGI